jgi:hypothetical protein
VCGVSSTGAAPSRGLAGDSRTVSRGPSWEDEGIADVTADPDKPAAITLVTGHGSENTEPPTALSFNKTATSTCRGDNLGDEAVDFRRLAKDFQGSHVREGFLGTAAS